MLAMNKPIHPVIAPDGVNAAYDDDAYGWAIEQAAYLRAGRADLLDWKNLAEEIEDVAKSEKRAAESALRIIMMHVLKWQLQPERRSRSWASSIASQRVAYEQVLDENPSLRAKAENMRQRAFARARLEAASEMDLPVAKVQTALLDWSVILEAPFEL
jgi:hypothetical protein